MSDYIVKDDGTATLDAGRYITEQTGSFATLGAANYYPSIEAAEAATTTPVAGDRILFSDIHAFSTAANISWGIAGVLYICVSDLAMEDGRRSGNRGSENSTGVSDITVANVTVSGIELISGDNIAFAGNNLLFDCELTVNGSGDIPLFLNSDGSNATLINSFINANNSGAIPISIISGADVKMFGGAIRTTGASITNMVNGGFVNGGGSIHMNGVDLTDISGTLIANVGSNVTVDDSIDIFFNLCPIATGVAFANEDFLSFNQRLLAIRCSDSSSAAEYQYYSHSLGADVDDDSTAFRNESPAFTDSAQKISYKIVTDANASLSSPLWFDMPLNKWSELSDSAKDELTFYLTSNDALTNKDIWPEIIFPNSVNKNMPNFLSGAPLTVGGTIDFMAAGTTLTTDVSSSWTGALSNLYEIALDTATTGSDSYPTIRWYVSKPSTTIHLSMDFNTL